MSSSVNDTMFVYWGKARATVAGPGWHPLVYHSLDVAAVGLAWMEAEPVATERAARRACLEVDVFRRLVLWLLSMHDLGKFAIGFQDLVPELSRALLGQHPERGYEPRHDEGGRALLGHVVRRLCQEGGLRVRAMEEELGPVDVADLTATWLTASTGHHGRPVPENPDHLRRVEPHGAVSAAAFAQAALDLFDVPEVVFAVSYDDVLPLVRRVSWWLAGLTTLCDWIGSNQRWFPYGAPVLSLPNWWQQAKARASVAVREAAVLSSNVSPFISFQHIFPKIDTSSPLQRLATEVPLGPSPRLFLIEDVTGAGKTEAALALAHRVMAAGDADGIYFALPTMATANAMHARVSAMYQSLYVRGERPTLRLAHSADRLQAMLPTEGDDDTHYKADEPSASTAATGWLYDDRRKCLLSSVGVGTVDQALLAALPSKFSALRAFGLSRKVLLVDEVHAYDDYTSEVLARLLRLHAAQGGTSIVLSATLPAALQRRLVGGLGFAALPACDAFPRLTRVDAGGVEALPTACRPGTEKAVAVTMLEDSEAAMDLLLRTVADGRCAVWIRNSVADAVAAWRLLASRVGERAELFHARYLLGDRLTIERRVVARFGKEGAAEGRRGRILVATQVVEQSLDLDFDEMVSDLAPIDLLIQRAGRLRRHARTSSGVLAAEEARGVPTLHVLAPKWTETPTKEWVSAVLPRTARVYPHHGRLYLTAQVLRREGAIRIPIRARALVESVYGTDATWPAGLDAVTMRAEGAEASGRSLGRMSTIDPDAGYAPEGVAWLDDTRTPTRLGDPQVMLRLARWEGERLVPLFERTGAWQLSQVSVRAAWVSNVPAPERERVATAAARDMPDGGRWCVVVPMTEVGSGAWSAAVDGHLDRPRRLFYSAATGLEVTE